MPERSQLLSLQLYRICLQLSDWLFWPKLRKWYQWVFSQPLPEQWTMCQHLWHYSCVPIGFAGKDCEQTVTDPCLFTSCSANGTDLCVATDNGFGYECKCKPSNCEIMLDTCSSQPCQNEPLASPETASTLVCALTSSKVPTVRTKSTRACHMPAIIAVLVQLCQWVKLQIKI